MKNYGFNFDNTYTTLPQKFFTECKPEKVAKPNIIILNEALSKSIGLDFSAQDEKELSDLLSGNKLPENTTPIALGYAGHQYGHFTILGDGRALLIGEHITPDRNRLDIHFKGSGKTPYSRRGDGKAALGPMLREYIISEAMHNMGIPTTRSLAVIATGEAVMRDELLPGAILTRVASSHIRVGTFEFAATQHGGEAVEKLLNYTINRHYPDIRKSNNKALSLLKKVIESQADLIVNWMRVGFIHGVMNTDNMAISGETIDYGPCAFMDRYDPKTVFSSIDHYGRYAFSNQPHIAQWNIARLADTLLPLIDSDLEKAHKIAEETVNEFAQIYYDKWLEMMHSKLGLFGNNHEDEKLIFDLLELIKLNHVDYTNIFYDLTFEKKLTGELHNKSTFKEWHSRWKKRLLKNSNNRESSLSLMKKNNPVVIPRNHRVEQALDAAQKGNMTLFNDLLDALKKPYEDRADIRKYQELPSDKERVYQTFCGT